ncbi:MAG: GGDEF domain-containing protein [Candidatus Omnitrophica bacterium]|nr:GGDEF domain-containing protein [Candidatus Omnitrophota bacterium]
MHVPARLRTLSPRFNTQRYRQVMIASVVTLLVSGSLLGLIGVTRWRGKRALETDTRSVVTQTAQQLLRALTSRRGTLTFLRDTLNRRADLTSAQLNALGTSATEHTRHLLGTGVIREGQLPQWWSGPQGLSPAELAQLNRTIVERTRIRGIWRVPSTFVAAMRSQRMLLVMLEPLNAAALRRSAVIGAFDVKPLLEDFIASNLPSHQPVQVLSEGTLLYRSSHWQPGTEDQRPILEEDHIAVDSARWTLQMQPGSTRVVQALSWFNVLLISLSLVAGLGVTIIVWLLTARTWLLQRAVTRRTAALRRTLKRLRQMAVTDELTGLHNRRFFLDRWAWECERAKRYQRPLACLMIDVNGFKQVNDRLGHPAGDLVLKHVAQELKTALRQSDILARFGGDEFVIALPETSLEQAEAVADKLRRVSIAVPGGTARRLPPVSLSVGLSRVEQDDDSPQEILQAADQSLYASKRHRKPSVAAPR